MGNNLTTNGQSATLNSRRSKSTFDRRRTLGRNVPDQPNNPNPQQETSRPPYFLYFLNRTWNAMIDANNGTGNGGNIDGVGRYNNERR